MHGDFVCVRSVMAVSLDLGREFMVTPSPWSDININCCLGLCGRLGDELSNLPPMTLQLSGTGGMVCPCAGALLATTLVGFWTTTRQVWDGM